LPTLLARFAAQDGGETTVLKTIDAGLLVEVSGADGANAAIKIAPSTSSDGIAALLDGRAELALSDRRAVTREVRAAQDLGLGDLRAETQEQIIALDGLLFLTHPRNPVRALTTGDAAAIFAGKITNWSEVGGSDLPIRLYASTADLGSAAVLDALVMEPAGLSVSPDATILGSDRVVAETVAEDPAAIGYARIGNEGPARPIAIRGTCNILTQPTAFTVKTEEYPLTRQLYIYRGKAPLSAVGDAFARFLASDAAQLDVASAGFVDQSITSATIDQQGMRIASAMMLETDPAQQQELRGMMDTLLAAERLSATFRYETGTDLLNARAAADLDRLANLLLTEAFSGKEILFLGFTDTVGDAALNRDLSQKRAEQIIAALLAEYPDVADNVRLTAIGYGEISSIACNDTDPGRAINRRVETWVRDFAQ
jgi:phosphate transport system substrate-binding protein